MLRQFWIVFVIIFAIGCSENESVEVQAPEAKLPTIVIEVYNFQTTRPGVLEKRFVIIDNKLTEMDVAFPESIYYLIRLGNRSGDPSLNNIHPTSEWIQLTENEEYHSHSDVRINVLDNHIVYPERRFEEQFGVEIDVSSPIQIGDRLEVVIRDRFVYREIDDFGQPTGSWREMIFVDVVRNLTRPEIQF